MLSTKLDAPWGLLSQLGRAAAIEEVRLSKTYENTRSSFVEFCSPSRAFLQFLHPNFLNHRLQACIAARSLHWCHG